MATKRYDEAVRAYIRLPRRLQGIAGRRQVRCGGGRSAAPGPAPGVEGLRPAAATDVADAVAESQPPPSSGTGRNSVSSRFDWDARKALRPYRCRPACRWRSAARTSGLATSRMQNASISKPSRWTRRSARPTTTWQWSSATGRLDHAEREVALAEKVRLQGESATEGRHQETSAGSRNAAPSHPYRSSHNSTHRIQNYELL